MRHNYSHNGIDYEILDTPLEKVCKASNGTFNYRFSKANGMFERWGETYDDDPEYNPIGCEILDFEVSSVEESVKFPDRVTTQDGKCHGVGCQDFCYKNSGKDGCKLIHTKLETVKTVLDKMNKNLMQIAFGVVSPMEAHPQIWDIFQECTDRDIVPNVTINQVLSDDTADKIASFCGATAVSVNSENKDIAYNAIKKLTDRGMKQINMHFTVSKQSLDSTYSVMSDIKTDYRLKEMNCIVFLGLKPKGAAVGKFNICNDNDFQKLVDYCLDNDIKFGGDSCSSGKITRAIKNTAHLSDNQKSQVLDMIESCESFGNFSSYFNVYGEYFPCSFAEGEGEWIDGMDVVECSDFLTDIWYSEKLSKYRDMSINSMCDGCRKCLIFDEIN